MGVVNIMPETSEQQSVSIALDTAVDLRTTNPSDLRIPAAAPQATLRYDGKQTLGEDDCSENYDRYIQSLCSARDTRLKQIAIRLEQSVRSHDGLFCFRIQYGIDFDPYDIVGRFFNVVYREMLPDHCITDHYERERVFLLKCDPKHLENIEYFRRMLERFQSNFRSSNVMFEIGGSDEPPGKRCRQYIPKPVTPMAAIDSGVCQTIRPEDEPLAKRHRQADKTARHMTIDSADPRFIACIHTEPCKLAQLQDRRNTRITLRGRGSFMEVPSVVTTFIIEAGLVWAKPPRVQKVLDVLNFEVRLDGEADGTIFDAMMEDFRPRFTKKEITIEVKRSRGFVCACQTIQDVDVSGV